MDWLRRIPRRFDRAIVVVMICTGLILPFAVGLGVKLYLQALGRPTWPWSAIWAYAIYYGPFASVIAASPLIVLAAVYRRWTVGGLRWVAKATPLQGRMVVLFAFAGCVTGMVRVFIDVFWVFDPIVLLLVPRLVLLYLPWMAGGLVVGALLAVIVGAFATKRARRRSDSTSAAAHPGEAPTAGRSTT